MASAPASLRADEAALKLIEEAIDRMAPDHEAAPAARLPRYRRILVAYDGSEGAKLALDWAKDLARLHGSDLLVANAYLPPNLGGAQMGYGWYPQIGELYEAAQTEARRLATRTASQLRATGLSAEAFALEGGPTRQISRLAHDQHADLVVAGARRHTAASRLLLGSTAAGLLEHAPCSVLLARMSPHPKRILVATDGSSVSYRAVAHALALASELDAELVVEHVLDYPDQVEAHATEGLLKSVVDRIELPAAPPKVRYLLDVGHAANQILRRGNREKADLVVLGSHGKGPLERAFVGSVSRRVALESPASVLVVKEAA